MPTAPNLNPAQHEAVNHTDGPLLIVAGAGTGKTTVIAQRLAWLIEQKLAKPNEILALTFTDKSAGEMEERVDALLPYGFLDLWVQTFHAFGERLLKAHGLDIGISNDFKLLTSTDAWLLTRENLDKFDLDYYRPLGNPTKFIHALLKHFSRCKDEMVTPEEYLKYAENLVLDSDDTLGSSKEILGDEKKRLNEIANAYHTYNQILLDNNALDFGDLINYTLKLFQTRPKILESYRCQFKYILVDEFQDTNLAQYELIKLLSATRNNLAVVGDDDQCLPGYSLIDTPGGKRQINKLERGDEVITAVGKGHLGVSKINRVFKHTKTAKIITLFTKKGMKVQVTDNHKMFCYIPSISNKKIFYVYLMRRHDSDWRLGITNDLATRLRLERSADSILALRAFSTEKKARYFETYWSLKYGIPTACFKTRKHTIIQGKLLAKLYKELSIEKNIRKLAEDLNIDLTAYHVCLNGVRRGKSTRIKINVQMCYRRRRSKEHVFSGKTLLYKQAITHLVHLETSDFKTITKLKKNNFNMHRTKKGWRYRFASVDIEKIGQVAEKIRWLTNGIIEYKFSVGRLKYQTLPALIIPAKNLVKGLYLPVCGEREIFYDEISDIKMIQKKLTVYDLEVEKTHNFIANGVVVHNSIYKFRGASISNILHFKNDYPNAKLVTLVENYRSAQSILDKAYQLIINNNPDRLEEKLKINKKLVAQKPITGLIEEIHARTSTEEARQVVEKIQTLKIADEEVGLENSWNDFAILIRSNAAADTFINALEQADVPFQFLASKGLYREGLVLDIISYLKLLDNYHENPAMWRVLNMPFWEIATEDIVKITHQAKKKTWSIFETLKHASALGVGEASEKNIAKMLGLVAKHAELARRESVGKVAYAFLNDSGYLKNLVTKSADGVQESMRQVMFLKQYYDTIIKFEEGNTEKLTKHYLSYLHYILESGEEGSLRGADEGPEAVKIMTVHSAKGLEFKHVFIVNLVEQKFPSTNRSESIELPDKLVKEILPEGDIHLQEERRLFYVAITRAKESVFFCHADDYGGTRQRKPSRFLTEINFVSDGVLKKEKKDALNSLHQPTRANSQKTAPANIPTHFSFTQLKAFATCPLQYRFAHILHIPVKGSASFSFGKTMHLALQRFYQKIIELNSQEQGDLFAAPAEPKINGQTQIPKLEELLNFYESAWIDDWYENKKQKEEYFAKGKKILKDFYEKSEWRVPKFLEAGFHLKIGGYRLRGQIDRIDPLPDGTIELIDYKTGSPKKQDDLKLEDKEQLLIYQLAAMESLGEKPSLLSFYYLDNNTKVSFLGTPAELNKIKEKVALSIDAIRASDFPAKPSTFNCAHCDFKGICEQAEG